MNPISIFLKTLKYIPLGIGLCFTKERWERWKGLACKDERSLDLRRRWKRKEMKQSFRWSKSLGWGWRRWWKWSLVRIREREKGGGYFWWLIFWENSWEGIMGKKIEKVPSSASFIRGCHYCKFYLKRCHSCKFPR